MLPEGKRTATKMRERRQLSLREGLPFLLLAANRSEPAGVGVAPVGHVVAARRRLIGRHQSGHEFLHGPDLAPVQDLWCQPRAPFKHDLAAAKAVDPRIAVDSEEAVIAF